MSLNKPTLYQLTVTPMMVLLLFTWSIISSCAPPDRHTADGLFYHAPDSLASYDLKDPDAKYLLPYVLEEVSGIAYLEDGLLACVQDEDGKVFLFNHKTSDIEEVIRFAGTGDYEGITVSGQTFYVAQSNGDIYKFKRGDKKPKVKKYETPLNKGNDVEGLTYDPLTNSLLLACKAEGELKGKGTKKKGFFTFDLQNKKLEKQPKFTLSKKKIKNYLEKHKDFVYEEDRINFKPSGIAIHPVSGHYYVIASIGKLLLVVDRKGDILSSIPLDPRLLGQPEGICFAPNGDLYLASEGQGDKGYILKFKEER